MSGLVAAESRVLIFGHEVSLLLSRKWLLSKLVHECQTVSTLAEFRASVLGGELGLIILCQSVSTGDCASACAFVAEHAPDIPLLMMFGRHARCDSESDHVLLDATAGPDAFIQTARRMLAQAATRAVSLG